MLTVDDIKKLVEVFATKEDLKQEVANLVGKEEFDQFKDDIFTKIDKVYGEVKAMREEQSMHSFRHDDTEKRLDAIESTPTVAHALKS